VPSKQTTAAKATANPPLTYNVGPFRVTVDRYEFRYTVVRPNGTKDELTEVEACDWDDSSAVWTGSLSFRQPDWMEQFAVSSGDRILAEFTKDGKTYVPAWTMRIQEPNQDVLQLATTAQLANDLVRLQTSTDDFVYAKGKKRPKGWRVDEVLRDVFTKYGVPIGSIPVMSAYITNWHLTDQHPLDVVHSALLREKTKSGLKYAVAMDPQGRVNVHPFRRPASLLEIGPTLVAATLSHVLNERFATEVTVKADLAATQKKDKKGHKKVVHSKVKVTVRTAGGVARYGIVHRNLYSPDANTQSEARAEGNQFLVAAGRAIQSFQVTLPGMPLLRRLDAFKIVLPDLNVAQIVYATDVKHSVPSGAGYTTDAVFTFDDPFSDDKSLRILNKLSDTAISRSRTAATPTTASQKPAVPKGPKSTKTTPPRRPDLRGVPTPAGGGV
jgi:hypothetical protein